MWKIIFILLVVSMLFLNAKISAAYEREIKSLSSSLAENISKAGNKTVAVVDFTDLQGNVTELGRFLAEEMSIDLANVSKGFEVMDRAHLRSILAEHKLSATGLIDPQTAKKLGKVAGVDGLVIGTITPFKDSMRLSVKILDTETARVISASSENIARTQAIDDLLGKGIVALSETQPAVPSPSKEAGKSVEEDGFIFKPINCKKSGRRAICTVSIQNTGNDEKKLSINAYPTGSMYDNNGNQYTTSKVGIGKQEYFFIENTFVPQVPVNVRFIAEDMQPEANLITLCISISGIKNLVVIRDIPISK